MSKENGLIRTTLGVTIIIFISKAIGFLRDIIQASYFGRGIENDAYAYAYSLYFLPILLFSSCITSTLVPLYVEARDRYSLKRANGFASNAMNLFSAFAVFASVIMYFLAGPLIKLIAPGISGEKFQLSIELSRIMLPSLALMVISITMSTILNAQERFIAPQLTGFPLSLAVIVAMVFFSAQHGIKAVAWGVFVAALLQVVIQIPSLTRSFHYSFRFNWRDKRFKRMLLLALPSVLSMAVNELNHLIDYALASGLEDGSAYTLKIAYSLITFVTGILIVPLTTVMFSRMSRGIVARGNAGIVEIVKQNIEILALALLPVTAISVVYSTDIIRIAYEHGNFNSADTWITAQVFICYVIGILAFGYRDFLNRAFHSMQNTRTPMINACVCIVINVGASIALREVMGLSGLALGSSIAGAFSVAILLFSLRKALGKMGMRQTAIELIKIVIATAWAALAALALQMLIPNASGTALAVARFGLCALLTLGIYGGIAILLRVRCLDFVRGLLRR